jgi:uncharacterized protein YndB with AHSA1/START domain
MTILETKVFATITGADPEQIWEALTATERPIDFLYGMTFRGEWRPGAIIVAGIGEQCQLTAEVLAVDRPHRLSYTLVDNEMEPSVFVTWEIIEHASATIIQLTVDEPQPTKGTDYDLEEAWLRVLLGLTNHLGGGPASSIVPPDGS